MRKDRSWPGVLAGRSLSGAHTPAPWIWCSVGEWHLSKHRNRPQGQRKVSYKARKCWSAGLRKSSYTIPYLQVQLCRFLISPAVSSLAMPTMTCSPRPGPRREPMPGLAATASAQAVTVTLRAFRPFLADRLHSGPIRLPNLTQWPFRQQIHP